MMDNGVSGEILKAYGQKEDVADPLWDSGFYKSSKPYRAMMHPLKENWQQLLGIFREFSLRWWKRRHLRS